MPSKRSQSNGEGKEAITGLDKRFDTGKHKVLLEPVKGVSIQIWVEGGVVGKVFWMRGHLNQAKGSAEPSKTMTGSLKS